MLAYSLVNLDVLPDSEFLNFSYKFFDIVVKFHCTLFIVMELLGISFSMIPAVMWPAVAYIVDQKRLGYRLRSNDHDASKLDMAAIPAYWFYK